MEMTVKLEVFEGPLDLLLHLLEKNKVSIYDIPIVEITRQYLEYIAEMRRRDLDVMSEFLVMAATLVDIKSRMLLPAREGDEEGEEEDPRAELVRQLLEYKTFKSLSLELKDRQVDAERVLYKGPSIPPEVAEYEAPVDVGELMSGVTLARLREIFRDVMRKQADKVDPVRSKFGRIEREKVSLAQKIAELESYCRGHKRFGFRSLLGGRGGRMEVIVEFLAVLEMTKVGKIKISQKNAFGEIEIESRIVA